MWIKICGITNLTDALQAAKSGASALGFVFAPSPRRVTAEQIAPIAARLPQNVERYGVFTDATFDAIVATVTEARLTGVQLHAHADDQILPRLRAHFAEQARSAPLTITRVLHFSPELDRQIEQATGDVALPDAILIDTRTERAVGGTGTRFDWKSARAVFLRHRSRVRLIAAGGLNPDNVEEALTTLEPWGVDVSSGVEATPGRKDPARVEAFIQRARRAGAQLDHWRAQPSPNS